MQWKTTIECQKCGTKHELIVDSVRNEVITCNHCHGGPLEVIKSQIYKGEGSPVRREKDTPEGSSK